MFLTVKIKAKNSLTPSRFSILHQNELDGDDMAYGDNSRRFLEYCLESSRTRD